MVWLPLWKPLGRPFSQALDVWKLPKPKTPQHLKHLTPKTLNPKHKVLNPKPLLAPPCCKFVGEADGCAAGGGGALTIGAADRTIGAGSWGL